MSSTAISTESRLLLHTLVLRLCDIERSVGSNAVQDIIEIIGNPCFPIQQFAMEVTSVSSCHEIMQAILENALDKNSLTRKQ